MKIYSSKHERVSDYILTNKWVLITVSTVVAAITSIITWNILN